MDDTPPTDEPQAPDLGAPPLTVEQQYEELPADLRGAIAELLGGQPSEQQKVFTMMAYQRGRIDGAIVAE